MTDGKLDALRCDPVFERLSPAHLLWLGRVVDLLDVPPGAVLAAADGPAAWGFYGRRARLHVLREGILVAPVPGPLLLLPDDLDGIALVAAAASQVVAFPRAVTATLLRVAPRLARVPRRPALRASSRGTR